jgi:hypothetical protein
MQVNIFVSDIGHQILFSFILIFISIVSLTLDSE